MKIGLINQNEDRFKTRTLDTTKGKCVKLGGQGDKVGSYYLLVQSSCESHPGMHWHFWSVQTPFLLQSTFVLHMNSENIL